MNRRVLVVGGSHEYVGAPYLAAIAALRSGAESVVVMAPEKVAWIINALSPDLITRKLKGKYLSSVHTPAIMRQLKTADVLVLGNGATTRSQTATLMHRLAKWPGLKVIDADALKVLRDSSLRNTILTPNAGEWKLLQQHTEVKKILAQGNVIIKKGMPTQILSAKKKFRQQRTNPGLVKAGTGDVLAGLCAGYLARGLTLFAAAKKAATIGNAIADILTRKKKGYFFLASDIVGEIRRL